MNREEKVAKAKTYWLFVGEPPQGTFQRVPKSTVIALMKSRQADQYEWRLVGDALFVKKKYFP